MKKLAVGKVAKAIELPPEDWIGNCYGISCKILDAGLVEGRAAYGHFLGKVNPDAPIFGKNFNRGWQRHGWIILEDGRILDATRWVFENEKPYIYIERNNIEYDEGGSVLRKFILQTKPFPKYDRTRHKEFKMDPDDLVHYQMLAGRKKIARWSLWQIAWIANLPYDMHDGREVRVYPLICKSAGKSLIPYDFQKKFAAEHGIELPDMEVVSG